ncbi:MAG: class I SAM-dependent methyltransferase [Methyloceanibacter sp.]|uniref:class I SAM-dependent methyltransferase n=1 Tax=Methyloceanibacter sp. TaxID=1965321 RepID=UPI003D9BC707
MDARADSKSVKQLAAARRLIAEIGEALDIDVSVMLWDGSRVPLGRNVTGPLIFTIAGPGVVTSMLRRPTLDRLIRLYAKGRVGLEGGTLIDLGLQLQQKSTRNRLKGLSKRKLAAALLPFLFAPADRPGRSRDYAGDETGRGRAPEENRGFVQFHYDVSNEFYALFLDPEMQYSCAYFTDWTGTVDQAQRDKLEMICRKLRLKPGERMLDIGCGWGGLVSYAAKNFGVTAHGITMSETQLAFARDKIAAEGLSGKVTVELRDYALVEGQYDKIASIGMYEHIGLANIPVYLTKVRSLLADGGLFLNHAISRRAKRKQTRLGSRPEQRAIMRYIFPGGELDDIGHTVQEMEINGFEVQDVENWRRHYALTTRAWCERLTGRREEAEAMVGPEVVRLWLAYLAGVSLAFTRGTLRIYQTLVSKQAKGPSPLPPTRADLYR